MVGHNKLFRIKPKSARVYQYVDSAQKKTAKRRKKTDHYVGDGERASHAIGRGSVSLQSARNGLKQVLQLAGDQSLALLQLWWNGAIAVESEVAAGYGVDVGIGSVLLHEMYHSFRSKGVREHQGVHKGGGGGGLG